VKGNRLYLTGDFPKALGETEFFLESQGRQITHALRVQYAVQMIALVLHHAGMEVFRVALESLSTGIESAVAYAPISGHNAA